jgi:hypothetical protein
MHHQFFLFFKKRYLCKKKNRESIFIAYRAGFIYIIILCPMVNPVRKKRDENGTGQDL